MYFSEVQKKPEAENCRAEDGGIRMSFTEEYSTIMAEYQEEVQKVQQKRKFFDGILGIGTRPGDAHCHEVMDQKVKELCDKAAAEADTDGAAELTGAIFRAAAEWKGPEYARLMLLAIQRHTLGLIPLLEKGKKEELSVFFEKSYPRRTRVPVQDQVLVLLKKV